MPSFDDVPPDVLESIFGSLGAADVVRVRAVSRDLSEAASAFLRARVSKADLHRAKFLEFAARVLDSMAKVYEACPSGALQTIERTRNRFHPDQLACRAQAHNFAALVRRFGAIAKVDYATTKLQHKRFKVDVRLKARLTDGLTIRCRIQSFSRKADGRRVMSFDILHYGTAPRWTFQVHVVDALVRPRWSGFATPVTIAEAPLHRDAALARYARMFKMMCAALPAMATMPGAILVLVRGCHNFSFRVTAADLLACET